MKKIKFLIVYVSSDCIQLGNQFPRNWFIEIPSDQVADILYFFKHETHEYNAVILNIIQMPQNTEITV